MDFWNTVFFICQGVLSVFSLMLIICKPFRMWFVDNKEKKKKMEKEENAIRCLLRSEILRIYYKNVVSKSIHSYEYENLSFLYQSYKELGGNSFIDKVWNEVSDWEIAR